MNTRLARELRKDFTLHVVLLPSGAARLGATNAKVALLSVEMHLAFAFDVKTSAKETQERTDRWVDRFLRGATEPFVSVGMIRAEYPDRKIYTFTVPVGGIKPVAELGPATPGAQVAAGDLLTMLAELCVWPEVAAQIEQDRKQMGLGPLGSQ